MNWLIACLSVLATITWLPDHAFAQTTRGNLAGAWSLVSVTVEEGGHKRDVQGPNPKGRLMLDSSGHYAVLTFSQDQGKFASNNRLEATPEESKALLSGTNAHYGTYSAEGGLLVFHIERSTFPNWNGIEQKRPFTLKGDELTYTTPGTTGAGPTQIVWKRLQ
jgi:Lipocalin-like domain